MAHEVLCHPSTARWQMLAQRRSALLAFARRLGCSNEDAEDVVHEALLRTAKSISLDEESVDRFVYTLVRRLVVDIYRRDRRNARLTAHVTLPPRSLGSPERAVEAREQLIRVKRLLEALPGRQRYVLQRSVAGASQHELAAELGISAKAVESVLGRARSKLYSWFSERDSLAA